MSDFEKFMTELSALKSDQDEMAKAFPVAEDGDGEDEAKIKAASEDCDDDTDDEAEDEALPMGKSFSLTLAGGKVVEAVDGTEMVKALQDELALTNTRHASALETTIGLIKGQSAMIKSLSDRVAALGNEGRGRKAVLSITEKPAPTTMAKSQPDGMTPDAFFTKALALQREGKISGNDIAIAESHLIRGEAIPANIISRVIG